MATPSGVNTASLVDWECFEFLDRHRVGRVCFIDSEGPLALPVSYRILGSDKKPYVVIRTSAGAALGEYEGPATLEVDEIDETARRACSVLARGNLTSIRGPHDLPNPQPWITEDRDRWLNLDVTALSGRRFVSRQRTDDFSVDWQLG
jgi:uncharacterized protein